MWNRGGFIPPDGTSQNVVVSPNPTPPLRELWHVHPSLSSRGWHGQHNPCLPWSRGRMQTCSTTAPNWRARVLSTRRLNEDPMAMSLIPPQSARAAALAQSRSQKMRQLFSMGKRNKKKSVNLVQLLPRTIWQCAGWRPPLKHSPWHFRDTGWNGQLTTHVHGETHRDGYTLLRPNATLANATQANRHLGQATSAKCHLGQILLVSTKWEQ